MNVKVGDKVRFLSETGGGRISRIEGRLVYVEDADGFEVPVVASEVVVVDEADDRAMAHGHKDFGRQNRKTLPDGNSWRSRLNNDEAQDEETDETETEIKLPQTEKKKPHAPEYSFDPNASDDKDPHFLLALTKTDEGRRPTLDLYVVNDTNYYASYTLMVINDRGRATTLSAETIEPNTKQFINALNPIGMDGQTWRVQLLLFKQNAAYEPFAPTDMQIKIKGTKIMRDTAFVSNDYFDQKAILFHIIKDQLQQKIEQLTTQDIELSQKEKQPEQTKKISRPSNVRSTIEVDLHIESLLEDTRGLDNHDMLTAQMNCVRSTIEEHKNHRGQKIIFIHGIGQGVLKAEIRKLLDTKYPRLTYQDAPFSTYGFGATQITI